MDIQPWTLIKRAFVNSQPRNPNRRSKPWLPPAVAGAHFTPHQHHSRQIQGGSLALGVGVHSSSRLFDFRFLFNRLVGHWRWVRACTRITICEVWRS